MDLLVLFVLLAAASAAVRAVGRVSVSNGPFSLGDLFRTSHDLGWPIGVQEEDGPVGWGGRVEALSEARAERPAEAIDAALTTLDGEPPQAAGGHAWVEVLHGGSVVPGTARR
jgi:hypothetical protein